MFLKNIYKHFKKKLCICVTFLLHLMYNHKKISYMKQQKEVSLPQKEQVKKIAHITLHENYGGLRAWLIQESYDGNIADPYSHQVLKREYFSNLQNVIMDYLSEGFEIEIKNQ